MSNTTKTLQSVVNMASTHADLLPLAGVGGYSNEPALSLCNDVIQELLSAPYDWKFNRVEMPMLVTCMNKQDYQFGGAVAFEIGTSANGVGIGLASNSAITVTGGVVTVNTLEAHRFSVGDTVYMRGVTMTTGTTSKYNSTFTDNGSSSTWSGGWVLTAVTSTSFSFAVTSGQNNNDIGGAPGITDFGWLASASMVEMNNTSSPQNTRYLHAVGQLQPMAQVGNPEKVCVLADNGDGTLKIRFTYVPGSTEWGANLVYQKKAPIKTALTDNWAPFPDEYSFVYQQGLLARMYRYINSPRSEPEDQKLQRAIMKALGRADAEMQETFVAPETSIMDRGSFWTNWY